MYENDEQIVTPWKVKAKKEINYDKLINEFGCEPITHKLLEKFTEVTGYEPHIWLKRGLFFSHRDLDELLDKYSNGMPIYIYTGRGPSGEMHLGHALPFIFTVWLQKVFKAIVVIQISDDEKFFFKDLDLDEVYKMGFKNARDIIAFGFDIDKTFIFSNIDYLCKENEVNKKKIMKAVNLNQLKKIYGFSKGNNIGQIQWPFHEMSPAFSSSFPHLFGKRTDIPCLIPCAIDQDPYFRNSRDIAPKMGWLKPYLIHGKFLVSLQGFGEKMGTSNDISGSIFLSDNIQNIRKKINKYACSGGQDTTEKHRELGADLKKDVAYQYLIFFEEDDNKLSEIGKNYESGKILSSEIKEYLIKRLSKFISVHQEKLNKVTSAIVDKFYELRQLNLN